MNLKSFRLIGATFALSLLMAGAARAASTAPFFDHVDQALTSKPSGKRLTAERFTLLKARLSVYAIYCDRTNSQGLNTDVYKLGQRTAALQKLTETALGGVKKAYNLFENDRNDESLRFLHFDDTTVCGDNRVVFDRYVRSTAADLTRTLTQTVFGQF